MMWTRGFLVVLSASCLVAVAAIASEVNLTRKPRITLSIQPLAPSGQSAESRGPHRLEIPPGESGRASFRVGWPDASSLVDVEIRGRQGEAPDGWYLGVSLDAKVTTRDGRELRAQRSVGVTDGTTLLFEILREENQPLTLAIAATVTTDVVVSRAEARSVGPPVQFMLEIQRIERGETISLETNALNTLVGEAVSYAFRLNRNDATEAVRVTLKPLRLAGEIVEIDVSISGMLPGEDQLDVLGRQERWVASRGVTSILAIESGRPPSGYRFLVTPRF
jgi:hypothetical protein